MDCDELLISSFDLKELRELGCPNCMMAKTVRWDENAKNRVLRLGRDVLIL
jgi:hypothetical protein